MKAVRFKIPHSSEETFRVQEDVAPQFYEHLHQHHEIQITYILKGVGTLLVEDYLGEFAPGDVFVIGSNASHLFKSPELLNPKGVHSISLFFDPNFLGEKFLNIPETHAFREFIKRTPTGMKFKQALASKAGRQVQNLLVLEGFKRLVGMLNLLELLSTSNSYENLGRTVPKSRSGLGQEERLDEVLQFTLREYKRTIPLSEAASVAHLTESAFCKYFKQHTSKTYFQFLNEIRVSQACRSLREKRGSIEQIAYASGFQNLSNFNRKFKTIIGITPSQFRKRYALTLEA